MSSLAALLVAMVLPFTPAGAWFGFQAPPPAVTASVGALVVAYLVCAELLKRFAIAPAIRRRVDGPRLGTGLKAP